MNTYLVMDLLQEQGPSRETQVQPPSSVWEHYFNIISGPYINVQVILRDQKNPGAQPEVRPFVGHHHVGTIEISGAINPNGSILMMQRVGHYEYNYWIYRSSDVEYAHLDWMLQTYYNPLRRSERRRWIII